MRYWFKYFFSAFLSMAFFIKGEAQDLDSIPSVIMRDSVYETPSSQNENYQFNERQEQEKIATRKVSDNDLNKLKSDKDYWYVNEKPPRDKETSSPPVNQKGEKDKENRSRGLFAIPWLNVVFWIILIAGFIALLVWFLQTSDVRLFRKKAKSVEDIIEETSEDIFEINFEKEIQKAITEKNLRLAVRLMYLRALKDLSNRHLINYTREKTNSDYLLQVAGTDYYNSFFRLTRRFDYIWYGQFELSPDSFSIIQNDFSSFKQQLSG